MGKNFLSLLISLLPLSVYAQKAIIPNFKNINVEQGLSQSSVYSIYQDKTGYMWFGTADGINRYDGDSIRVYKVPFSNGIATSNSIQGSIVEDAIGNIWFCTLSGIYVINSINDQVVQKFVFTKTTNEVGNYKLQFIKNDSLWLFHPRTGVCCYDISKNSLKIFSLPFTSSAVNTTRIDSKSAFPFIWFSQFPGNSVWQFDAQEKNYTKIIKNQTEWTAYTKINNSVFLFTFSSIKQYDINKKLLANLNLDSANSPVIVRDILIDKYNRLWIATLNKGLMMYDYATQQLSSYIHSNHKQHTLSISLTNCLRIDKNDNLWIGTDGGGVCRLDLKPSPFNKFPLNEGDYPVLKDYFTKCFYKDEENRIWFGTHNSGFCIYDQKKEKLECITNINGKKIMIVGDIIKDRDNNIWIGHSNGVARYDVKTKKFLELKFETYFPLHTGNIYVYRLIQRQNSDIVAATRLTLLNIHKTKNGGYTANAMLPGSDKLPPVITDIKELPNHSLIFTAPDYGVYIIDSNLNNIRIKNIFLKNFDLRCVVLNKNVAGHAWVGSHAGLIDLDYTTGNYKLYNRIKGFSNEYIYSVLPDKKGNLWLSTNGGITVFNTETGFVKNFTANDGLQSNEFNTGAYYTSASGEFFFGGIKGFNWVNPSSLNSDQSYPVAAISSLLVNNKPYYKNSSTIANNQVRLKYFENDLFFRISVLDYTKPEANKIWYQLKGWDKEPIISSVKEIRYNNLPPGNYEFLVKGANWSGAWSDKNCTIIYITIKSPFWKTSWFYAMAGLLITALIVTVTWYISQTKLKEKLRELEKQKEVDRERQRISREMHDDIGAGLTQITLMSESAKGRIRAKELDDIADTSRTLVSNMSEIIWSLNQENKSLDRLWAYLREQLNHLLEYSGIEYCINFPEDGSQVILSNEQRRNILLVSKEIVNNALKHSNASLITIKGTIEKNSLCFTISDNGTGFNTATTFAGNGLKNIQNRIKEIGGSIEIVTLPGMGTIFTYALPLAITT